MECLHPMVYDWCIGILNNLRIQSIYCKIEKIKNFGYGSILRGLIYSIGHEEDHRLTGLMRGSLDGEPKMININDYAYSGMDFHGYLDMIYPLDAK